MRLNIVRRAAGVAMGLAIGVSACATSDAYEDSAECISSTMVLMAQAVPTAQSIPCLTEPLDGWSVSVTHVGDDGATIRFRSQITDKRWARLDYRSVCVAEAAVDLPVEGGCVSVGFSADVDAEHRWQLLDRIALLSRRELQENLRRDFIKDAEL